MPTQQIQVFFPQFCDPEFSKISRIDTRTIKISQKNWEIGENRPNLWKEKKTLSNTSIYSNPLYIYALGDHFFWVTPPNCDLNVYGHILYKLLQDCDYRPKKN